MTHTIEELPTGDQKVIRDRIANTYLSSWSGPESAPTSFTWAAGIGNAHGLTQLQAHMLRAGIIAVSPEAGGRPEAQVAIIDMQSAHAFAKELASGATGMDKVLLSHPLHGYYVRHRVDGTTWSVDWNQSSANAAIIPRHQAEMIRDMSGMVALEIIEVKALTPRDIAERKATGEITPPQPKRRMRYEILIESTSADLEDLVNKALAEGAQLVGGLVVNPSAVEYLQAIVRPEQVAS